MAERSDAGAGVHDHECVCGATCNLHRLQLLKTIPHTNRCIHIASTTVCTLKDSTALLNNHCAADQRFTTGLVRLHAEAPQGHAGPHRLADKMSPSQPSSVGTEATCPVVVAHILARWRMPMVRPVCPCTWVVPLVGLGSTMWGGEGAG